MGEPGSGGTSASSPGSSGNVNDDIPDPAVVASMTADELKKFIDTGRTGRRNALPDVSQPGVMSTSTAGMAEAMESLSVQSGSGSSSSSKDKSASSSTDAGS